MSVMALSKRVTLQQRTAGQDAAGQPLTTWADVATVWGHIGYLSGYETIKADASSSSTKASIRIRARAGTTSDMRAVCGGVTYSIDAVLPDGARFINLACTVLA